MRTHLTFITGFLAGCLLTAGIFILLADAEIPPTTVATQKAISSTETPQEVTATAKSTQDTQGATTTTGAIKATQKLTVTAEAPLLPKAATPSTTMSPSTNASFMRSETNTTVHPLSPIGQHLAKPIQTASQFTNLKNVAVIHQQNASPQDFLFSSTPEKFSLRKLGNSDGSTLLVVGGIQGDEPGGFSAASLLATHYNITKGAVWVVPDLNFASILCRSRGIFGDMNRKFSTLSTTDPEYALVDNLKQILLAEEVDLILNLHDGSGFYRTKWMDRLRNPSRWGQCVIIDQEEMDAPQFSKLHAMALQAEKDANTLLIHPEHHYTIRNTKTALGDKEMEKSLSWFAVMNGKPAFGIEASKEFTTEFRSYYHMVLIESFMKQMGIQYTRKYSLSPQGILLALNSGLALSLYDGKIVLPLDNIRPTIKYLPFNKDEAPRIKASRPLLTLVNENNSWRIAYGNRTITRINPEMMPFDDSISQIDAVIDGENKIIHIGEIIPIKKSFTVFISNSYRVNAIGALKEINGTEAGVELAFSDFIDRFSVDLSGYIYRVEIYKNDAFCGSFLADFTPEGSYAATSPLTPVSNENESDLGY